MRVNLRTVCFTISVDYYVSDAVCNAVIEDIAACPISPTDSDVALLFPPSTTLHFLSLSTSPSTAHCEPVLDASALTILIPTGIISDLPFAELINFLVVWGALVYVTWTTRKARRRWDNTPNEGEKKID